MEKIGKRLADYKTKIVLILMFLLIIFVGISTVNYPKKMKKMFIQSSVKALEDKLTAAAGFTNENIEMNNEEINLIVNMISNHLDGSDHYSQDALDVLSVTKENSEFQQLGIIKTGADNFFATMSDGNKVQVDAWTMDLDFDTSRVAIDLQTSPFRIEDTGKDVVVYRRVFEAPSGDTYMLIAEKSQETLKTILSLEDEEEKLTLVIRDNGNVVYSNGKVEAETVVSYNFFAYLSKLGASDEQLETIRTQLSDEPSGMFQILVGNEPYYFVYNSINHTDWICINACSESVMTGKNLKTVNSATIHLVVIVVIVLLTALVMSVVIAVSNTRKRAEEKLLQRENLFEEMSRHIPNAFAIIKKGSREPTFLAHNFYEILQEPEFDFSVEGICKWASIELTDEVRKSFRETQRYSAVISKNERYYAMGVYNIGVIDQSQYYVLILTDATKEINARKLLEDSIVRADSASKSKTQFLSKMSHEIRTPLNSVIGFSKLALDRWDSTEKEELHDYMNKIQISGNYLLELVSDILDISRIEEGRMEINKVDYRLSELIDEVKDSFAGQMERKQLDFIVRKKFDDVILHMDAFHIKQILNNLISNAYKYTDEGGSVTLTVRGRMMDDKRMAVRFEIEDTGIGMTEEFVRKIFDPFTQEDRGMMMKKQLRGSGLGMSICKNLVELQDGTIRVDSELGEGSIFTVQMNFEVVDHVDSSAEDQKVSVDYGCLKDKKILVVDDIEMNRIIIEKFLSYYGLVFVDAVDGQEAVEAFNASKEDEFFAIFMDVQMPVLNGYEATEAIRKLARRDAKTVAIVGMTADAFSDDVNKAMMSGMNYHVTKPIQVEKVLDVLMDINDREDEKE